MSRLPSYTHFTDTELLRECDQHYADGLIVELAKRLAEVADERDELEAEVDRLKSEINELEEKRDELQTLLQAADNQIFSLKGDVLDLKQAAQ